MSETSPLEPLGEADRDALRELADAGMGAALDRLADLASARGDVDELRALLDEGCACAGDHLADRAIAARDLRELQCLADEGVERAERELERLLR